ncbi:MAG: sulfatase-like hydrolase/transferase [Gemmatimonadota bacterium]|nr:sulfatase-like hydrolase/transferase [Gemmatimonadota bacterium]
MGREDRGGTRVADVLIVAVALGFVVGFGEVLGLGWRYFVRDVLTHVSPHTAWMAPLGYAALFAVLSPIGIALRASFGLAPMVFICVALGLIGWIALLPWGLHPAAAIVLALGAAVQLARLSNRQSPRLTRYARTVASALGLLVAILAAIVFWIYGSTERAAYAGRGQATAEAPNIILLVLDTVRARSLGLHGGPEWVSPNIDALATSSVVFDNAIATSPWTLPSHASMFTGRWPHELSVGWSSPLDSAEPTLAEFLASRGYATAGFVANLSYTSRPFGLSRGFARYEDFPVTVGQTVLSTSLGRVLTTMDGLRAVLDNHELLNRKTARRINADFLDWLDGRPDGPFFAFLNYFDAHEPYEPPGPLRERVAPGYVRDNMGHRHNLLRGINARRLLKAEMPEGDIPLELALYEATINALDAEIGVLMGDLAVRGLLDNSVLILTSDHGEHMGEHGIFEHGQTLYEAAVHVPLIVRPPTGIDGGRRVPRPVSIRDIPATLIELTGGNSAAFPGASLAPTWSGDARVRQGAVVSPAVSELARGNVEQPWYPIAAGLEMQSMQSGSLYYICNPDAAEELYDLEVDPAESNNLAGTPDGDRAILAFREVIAEVGAPPRWCPPPAEEAPRRPERGR